MATRDGIIAYLRDHDGRVTSSDGWGITQAIADQLGVTQSAISQQLRRIEADGLVGRDQRGKRLFALYLTEGAGAATSPSATRGEAHETGSAPGHQPKQPSKKPPPPGVTVTTMRCGERIDRALERCDDPVVVGAFAACEDTMANYTDEVAELRQLVMDRNALLARLAPHVNDATLADLHPDDQQMLVNLRGTTDDHDPDDRQLDPVA